MTSDEELSFYDKDDLFCYLGDRLYASVKSELAVTARTRIRWNVIRETG